ncbi:MAG: helix-turn-helix domain-containing protein [Pseudonocardiaceae bacterium]
MAKLADLLTGPTARRALACRDIAAVFRILRDAGVSQASIALATGQRQSEVSNIIAGRQVQAVAVLERIADGLGVPRGWMGLAYSPGLAPESAAPQDAATEEERNANLLRHGGNLLCGQPVFGAADPIPVKDAPTPVPRRIGLEDVKQVAVTTERLGQLAANLGGIPITEALTAHTKISEALLGASMHEPVRQQMLIALSDAHRAAGGAASDSGLLDLGRRHYIRSMECAGAGGDQVRVVEPLDRLGMLELNVEPNEALKLFQLGAAGAPSQLSRAPLEYNCALALGLLGLEEEALAALRRAHDFYQAAGDEPRPWEHFAAALPHVEGATYFALRRFDRAAAPLAAAADAASHAVGCTVANSSLLAAAQLRCGELRSGLATASRMIGLAKDLRSVWMRSQLAPLQEAAAARRDSACQDLAREVATLRSAT